MSLPTNKNCTAPDCKKESEYDSPGYWCETHWNQWWNHPEEEPEPNWMKNARSSDGD